MADLIRDWQAYFKACSFAGFTQSQNLSAMTRDDSVRSRQAQAGAALALCAKERFEYSGYCFRAHSTPCISYPKAATINLAECSQFHHASIRHCIDRIED